MDRLTAATVFIDVASTQSFTATAKRLEMSRPMVTRHVEAMENWLNVRLLNRTTRKVSLTSAGERCLQEVQAWVEQAQGLKNQLMVHSELSGRIRVTASLSFGFAQLIPAVKSFMDRHPRVDIDIDVQDRTVDLIAERIDLAIRITPSPDPSLIGRPIAKCDSVLVASQAYLDSAPKLEEPADLAAHQCLGHENFEHHVWNLRRDQRHESIEVNCQLKSNEAMVLLNAAIHGMGVSLQPTYLANSALERGALVQVLPQWQPKVMDIYALYPSRKHLSPAVRHLIDHLDDYFSSGEWQDLPF
ncbi:LysR family transcriptional regulator [Marinobacter halodurans]|uniref:LysR family transcriptional regulator n=2 Tax=Marinobacter halodurans TaxID=2528979 RepID=A0ABY1ZJ78_9GAMM|nr:LysR family transcriptional regulator [Marinobacter halodurans]